MAAAPSCIALSLLAGGILVGHVLLDSDHRGNGVGRLPAAGGVVLMDLWLSVGSSLLLGVSVVVSGDDV